jgi:hypothetical protein
LYFNWKCFFKGLNQGLNKQVFVKHVFNHDFSCFTHATFTATSALGACPPDPQMSREALPRGPL